MMAFYCGIFRHPPKNIVHTHPKLRIDQNKNVSIEQFYWHFHCCFQLCLFLPNQLRFFGMIHFDRDLQG